MSGADRAKLRRQRARLFIEQDGKCFYCQTDMILMMHAPTKAWRRPPNLCTIEHLRDRFHPERQTPNTAGEKRRVVACLECNGRVAAERERAQPRHELWRRAGAYPLEVRFACEATP